MGAYRVLAGDWPADAGYFGLSRAALFHQRLETTRHHQANMDTLVAMGYRHRRLYSMMVVLRPLVAEVLTSILKPLPW